MEGRRYKPLVDKLFWIISIPTLAILVAVTALCLVEPGVLFIIAPVDLFTVYFLLSPLFGYVELRERCLFIKYGFILKKEIPYEKIREVKKARGFLSYSFLSLKNSFEHIDIKYNSFDMTTVSVIDNDGFIEALGRATSKNKTPIE